MKKIFRLFIFLALISSGQSFAGYDGYICTILQIQKVDDSSGKFVKEVLSTGGRFTIDRDTGKIIGSFLSNGGYYLRKVQHRGGEGYGYNHIAIKNRDGRGEVQYVYVMEFAEGLKKPFLATLMNYMIVSGLCE